MMAPSTWLTFQRGEVGVSGESGVTCTARTCVFFVVPFKVQRVQQVTEVTFRERAGALSGSGSMDATRTSSSCGRRRIPPNPRTGEEFAEVSVSPASIENVANKANDFVKSNQTGSTTIFAIANWKFED